MTPELIRTILVILGIGMIIFVHEGGHFIAARMCGVKVEVFSLGFGPKLLGFRRKGTLYQLALVPFGGYVRMKGEFDQKDGGPPPSDSLHAKNVPQRFIIYAGGVIMNVVFALVCFPIVYHFGVPAIRPVVGSTQPGMPAWHARIPEGAKILKVQGRDVNDFMGIPAEVAIAGSSPVTFLMQYPGEDIAREVVLNPVKDERNGFFRVGLSPAADPDWIVDVEEGSVAYAAGLRTGDSILAVQGASPGQSPTDAMTQHFAEQRPLVLETDRAGVQNTITIEPSWESIDSKDVFGIEPPSNLVRDIRPSEDLSSLGLEAQDRILAVGDTPILRNTDLLLALRNFPGGPLSMEVEREGKPRTLQLPDFQSERAALLFADIALSQDLDSTVVLVRPQSGAALGGLITGDRLIELNGQPVKEWQDIQNLAAIASSREAQLEFKVQRRGEELPVALTASAAPANALSYGFAFLSGMYTFRTNSVGAAISMGARSSVRMLREAMLTLRQMFRQEISPKNLGGVLTIGKVSYQASSMGWTKLLFFLCMLSVNLAFLNVLPIPLLDGGHLFFLLIEGIKGSPVSERIMGYSQLVGLVLILSLMVYVTYQDILRLL